MLEDSLRKWNPWWADVTLLTDLIGIQRTVIPTITETMTLPHIKDIIGVRRSGKSTILYQIIDLLINKKIDPKNIVFLNFDDPDISMVSYDDLMKTLETINPQISHVFLDEIQQKKDWERWLRMLYDTKKYNQMFISGSSAALLNQDIGRVLSGRHLTFIVFPFSFKEYLTFIGWKSFTSDYLKHQQNTLIHHLNAYIEGGGFPEVIGKNEFQRKIILTNIYNDVLSRDITARHNTTYSIAQKISYHVLTNNAREFSFRSVARATQLSIETVEKYLEYLKESYLILTLDVFSYKTKIQFKQNKKVYCIDTGLRNAVSFKISEDRGRLAENLVCVELKRRSKEIYYWKNSKHEVDFVVKEGLKPTELIQVCWDISDEKTKKREVDALIAAMNTLNMSNGIVLTKDLLAEETIDNKIIRYIPLWRWLLET
ncbi:MAG: ATP-binding protein [Euryarchaeota archaeon]|nr:ATP-binding protein [Euryarchaeota archaeon]